MNDRELLEAAAKAVGFIDDPKSASCALGLHKSVDGNIYIVTEDGWNDWCPLTNDGDAFRLAVVLRLDVWFCGMNAVQVAGADHPITTEAICIETDARSATRRAIVRAAAAIGRSMD